MVRRVIEFLLKKFPKLGLSLRIDKFMKSSINKIDRNGVSFGEDIDSNLKLVLTEEERRC